jgi:hypothetical protein
MKCKTIRGHCNRLKTLDLAQLRYYLFYILTDLFVVHIRHDFGTIRVKHNATRTDGSPPVSRILSTPNSTNNLDNLINSLVVSNLSAADNGTP